MTNHFPIRNSEKIESRDSHLQASSNGSLTRGALLNRNARLTGARCKCGACGELFNSVRAFDRHRTGSFQPLMRRCRTPKEMQALRMSRKRAGFWITETRQERVRRRGRTTRSGDRLPLGSSSPAFEWSSTSPAEAPDVC